MDGINTAGTDHVASHRGVYSGRRDAVCVLHDHGCQSDVEQQSVANPGRHGFRRRLHEECRRRLHLHVQNEGAAGFDATATHSIGVTATRDLSEFMHVRRMGRDVKRCFQFRAERIAGEGHPASGPDDRLQSVSRSADRAWRIAADSRDVHPLPHAADHQSGHRT